jgi:hypothetical protein
MTLPSSFFKSTFASFLFTFDCRPIGAGDEYATAHFVQHARRISALRKPASEKLLSNIGWRFELLPRVDAAVVANQLPDSDELHGSFPLLGQSVFWESIIR